MTRTAMLIVAASLIAAGTCYATPSTLVWIPSTDIQGLKTWHFGVDDLINYGSPEKMKSDATVVGLTYGPAESFEVGLDIFSGIDDPLFLNAKWASRPFGKQGEWTGALGGYNFGFDSATSPDILYGMVSYKPGKDRFTLGYFKGDDSVLVDPVSGSDESDGLLLGWDRSFGNKWWGSVDYQGGDSTYGAASFGVAYSLSDSASVLLGMNFFNNSAIDDTVTIQFDLNFD